MELNKLYKGDCNDHMEKWPNEFIDLVLTSPPYDQLRLYKGHYNFDFEKTAKNLYNKLKDGGILVWVVSDQTINGSESGTSFKQALYFKEIGFNLHDTMIYESSGPTLNHNRYEQDFEYMFVFSKGKPKTFNPIKIPCAWFGKDSDRTGQKYKRHKEPNRKLKSDGKRGNIKPTKIKGNIWRYNTGAGHSSKDKIAFQHPAIFPEKLVRDHVLSWSNKGDLVYDPFAGSGTTPKVCVVLERQWLASEIADEYCEIIDERLEIYNKPNLFNYGNK